jgi:hypothetical protein
MLMILKEVYSSIGIYADSHVPQQNAPADYRTSSTRSCSDTLLDASGQNLSDTVLENKETGLEGIQLDSSFMSSHIESSPDTTYAIDRQSSAALLTAPSGPVASSFVPSTPPSNNQSVMGMDPTAPLTENKNLGPPPMTGFFRK